MFLCFIRNKQQSYVYVLEIKSSKKSMTTQSEKSDAINGQKCNAMVKQKRNINTNYGRRNTAQKIKQHEPKQNRE